MDITIYETPTSINYDAHSKVDLSIIPTDLSKDKYVSFAEYINFGKLKRFGINGMSGTDYYWDDADKEITWPEFVEVLNKIINKLYDEATSGGTGKQTPNLSWSRSSDTIEYGNINQYTQPTLNNPGNLELTYSSSNPSIATVDTSGKISLTGIIGTVTITATFAGNDMYYMTEAKYKITVNQAQSINDIYIGFKNPNDVNIEKNEYIKLSDLDTIDETYKKYDKTWIGQQNELYILIPNNYELSELSIPGANITFSPITSNDTNYNLYKTTSGMNGGGTITCIFKIKNGSPDITPDDPQEDDGTIYVEFGDTFGGVGNPNYTLKNGTLRNAQTNLYEYKLEGYDSIDNQYLYIKLNNGDTLNSITNLTREYQYTYGEPIVENESLLYRSNQPFTSSSGVNLLIYVVKKQ